MRRPRKPEPLIRGTSRTMPIGKASHERPPHPPRTQLDNTDDWTAHTERRLCLPITLHGWADTIRGLQATFPAGAVLPRCNGTGHLPITHVTTDHKSCK